jgi:probable HAF family extracellular repeat protein
MWQMLDAYTATVTVATSVSRYTVMDLGKAPNNPPPPFDNGYDQIAAVNTAGMVVGTSAGDAFVWSGGIAKLLGGPLGTTATAINASGQVVGTANGHPFLYAGGTLQDLGFAGGATAINAAGQIVGYTSSPTSPEHAFLYAKGVMTDLGVLPGGYDSVATGINVSGQIVGYSTVNGARHAFLYTNGKLQDLGIPSGYTQSQALAINDRGQIAGALINSSDERLFLYANGVMTDLGSLGAPPNTIINPAGGPPNSSFGDAVASINNSGQIVATLLNRYHSQVNNGATDAGFLYSGGVLQTLAGLVPSGSSLDPRTATGINDAGQIVGAGYINNSFEWFMMTPQ